MSLDIGAISASYLKRLVKSVASFTPYEICSRAAITENNESVYYLQTLLNRLSINIRSRAHVELVLEDIKKDNLYGLAAMIGYSYSQLSQDLFALSQLPPDKSKGFFVEFGATDGIQLSNTYLLEKHLGWDGILAEPARVWHSKLFVNRECSIDTRCVGPESGVMAKFLEVIQDGIDPRISPELSALKQYSDSGDWATSYRLSNSTMYHVETISLNDLLSCHGAPSDITYLSIDTEGSEYAILSSLDFSKYRFRAITIEHNYGAQRQDVYALLRKHGYKRVYEQISAWDDWYVPDRYEKDHPY